MDQSHKHYMRCLSRLKIGDIIEIQLKYYHNELVKGEVIVNNINNCLNFAEFIGLPTPIMIGSEGTDNPFWIIQSDFRKEFSIPSRIKRAYWIMHDQSRVLRKISHKYE